MRPKTILLILLVVAVVASIIVIVKYYLDKAGTTNEKPDNVTVSDPVTKEVIVYQTKGMDIYKPLSVGSKGEEVKTLQILLNKLNSGLDTDGDFGPLTEAALLKNFGVKSASLAQVFEKQGATTNNGNLVKKGGNDMKGKQISVGQRAWTQNPEVIYQLLPKIGGQKATYDDFTIPYNGEYKAGANFDLGVIIDATGNEVITRKQELVSGSASNYQDKYYYARNTQIAVV